MCLVCGTCVHTCYTLDMQEDNVKTEVSKCPRCKRRMWREGDWFMCENKHRYPVEKISGKKKDK